MVIFFSKQLNEQSVYLSAKELSIFQVLPFVELIPPASKANGPPKFIFYLSVPLYLNAYWTDFD